jgi:hypothetical protein
VVNGPVRSNLLSDQRSRSAPSHRDFANSLCAAPVTPGLPSGCGQRARAP